LQIRAAGVGDAAGLARVVTHAWQTAYRGVFPDELLDALDVDDRARRFAERFADADYPKDREWLCERDGEIVGWLAWLPSRDEDADPALVAEIAAVYVHPTAWGLGAGAMLMNHVHEHITGLAIYTETTLWVLEKTPQARRFYERAGYRVDGTSRPTVARSAAGTRTSQPEFPEILQVRYRRPLALDKPEGIIGRS
jgi:GNAT superfamily N-acetyltransferase